MVWRVGVARPRVEKRLLMARGVCRCCRRTFLRIAAAGSSPGGSRRGSISTLRAATESIFAIHRALRGVGAITAVATGDSVFFRRATWPTRSVHGNAPGRGTGQQTFKERAVSSVQITNASLWRREGPHTGRSPLPGLWKGIMCRGSSAFLVARS